MSQVEKLRCRQCGRLLEGYRSRSGRLLVRPHGPRRGSGMHCPGSGQRGILEGDTPATVAEKMQQARKVFDLFRELP